MKAWVQILLTEIREKQAADRKPNSVSASWSGEDFRAVNIAWRIKTASIENGKQEEEHNSGRITTSISGEGKLGDQRSIAAQDNNASDLAKRS